MSRALQQLAGTGYVTLQADKKDGRRTTVSPTAEGEALHDRIFSAAMEREQRLLADLSPKEVDTLVDLLGRLHAQVGYVNEYEPGGD